MDQYKKTADTHLIKACLKGDSKAWEELLKRYRRLIYSIPYKYHLMPEEAADVFQSVCVALLESLSTLRDETKLSSWLITTTTRECWKMKKRQSQQLADLNDEEDGIAQIPSEDRLPVDVVQDLQEQQLVRQAIMQLDERCQTLLTYLFYKREEWSYQRISDELGIPTSSIGPTRGRCLEKLKRVLRKLGLS